MTEAQPKNAALSAMLFEANKKSVGVAYLLWFFLGGFGAHRFYAGHTASAVAMLVLFILGWLTILLGVGLILLVAVGIWALIDAFLIPGWIRADNTNLVEKIIQ